MTAAAVATMLASKLTKDHPAKMASECREEITLVTQGYFGCMWRRAAATP